MKLIYLYAIYQRTSRLRREKQITTQIVEAIEQPVCTQSIKEHLASGEKSKSQLCACLVVILLLCTQSIKEHLASGEKSKSQRFMPIKINPLFCTKSIPACLRHTGMKEHSCKQVEKKI
jgi:hypothetical protein